MNNEPDEFRNNLSRYYYTRILLATNVLQLLAFSSVVGRGQTNFKVFKLSCRDVLYLPTFVTATIYRFLKSVK